MQIATYSRVNLACEQLESALKLFLCKSPRFASALTLAGVADEIFGKVLEQQGKNCAVRRWFLSSMDSPTWREYINEQNYARNAVKHMHNLDEMAIEFGLEDAAAMMLLRACQNFEALGFKQTWRIKRFNTWFYKWAT